MKTRLARTIRRGRQLLLLVLGLAAANAFPQPATNQHVILISIDGCAAAYLTDPRADLPTLRKLAQTGAGAEGLRVSNPAVTWPNHTTLVTGVSPAKHSVLFNGRLVRNGPGASVQIDGARDKAELVAVPTLYDRLHQAGYRTANLNWPATRNAPTLDDNFPDVPGAIAAMTPALRQELIHAGILADASDATFRSRGAAAADTAWTAAAVHIIRARQPHFLLLHLLNPDTVQHQSGPQSAAAFRALAAADAHVAEILQAVERAGLTAQTTIFVVSDHGFVRPEKIINPNVVLRKAGMFRPAPNRRAQCLSEGGIAFVYLPHPDTKAEDHAKILRLFAAYEGIADIIEPPRFAMLGLPDPAQNPQMGDLILVAQADYAFGNEAFDDEEILTAQTPVGSHGYLASDSRMNGIFIAAGRGIKPGTKLALVDNLDVAPTIAALFSVTMPYADGEVLRKILATPKN